VSSPLKVLISPQLFLSFYLLNRLVDGSATVQRLAMNENKETNDTIDEQHIPGQGTHLEDRLEQDRRSDPSKGFAYITTVGWIDRRERTRRKDDPFDY
jgi:hypothetical protein